MPRFYTTNDRLRDALGSFSSGAGGIAKGQQELRELDFAQKRDTRAEERHAAQMQAYELDFQRAKAKAAQMEAQIAEKAADDEVIRNQLLEQSRSLGPEEKEEAAFQLQLSLMSNEGARDEAVKRRAQHKEAVALHRARMEAAELLPTMVEDGSLSEEELPLYQEALMSEDDPMKIFGDLDARRKAWAHSQERAGAWEEAKTKADEMWGRFSDPIAKSQAQVAWNEAWSGRSRGDPAKAWADVQEAFYKDQENLIEEREELREKKKLPKPQDPFLDPAFEEGGERRGAHDARKQRERDSRLGRVGGGVEANDEKLKIKAGAAAAGVELTDPRIQDLLKDLGKDDGSITRGPKVGVK